MRWRAAGIGAWLFVFALAQVLAVVAHTNQLWPFNAIAVYYDYSDGNSATATEVVLVGANGETNIAATGLGNRNLSHRFSAAVDRADSQQARNRIAALYFELAKGRAKSAFRFTGLRIYRKQWDLDQRRIVRSVLLAEYLYP